VGWFIGFGVEVLYPVLPGDVDTRFKYVKRRWGLFDVGRCLEGL